jgi:ABC-type multidrug transport system ATPase subunit
MSVSGIHIQLNNIGKKFGSEWIFRNIDLTISPGEKMVILGGNGSGKSTLLQVISGYVLANEGKVIYKNGNKDLEPELYKNQLSFASPYLELIEEFSFKELIAHCASFKPFLNNLSSKEIVELSELGHAKEKFIKTYSSGMKQRVKLALAILADAPLLFLDEPASNLDKNAIEWYKRMVKQFAMNKTVMVCSNSISEEFEFCTSEINLVNYKPPVKA